MKNLLLAVLISISTVCAPVVSAAQQQGMDSIFAGSSIERMVQCYWLSASSDSAEGGDSDAPPEEEEEPDCE
jgi:hypothetical protein